MGLRPGASPDLWAWGWGLLADLIAPGLWLVLRASARPGVALAAGHRRPSALGVRASGAASRQRAAILRSRWASGKELVSSRVHARTCHRHSARPWPPRCHPRPCGSSGNSPTCFGPSAGFEDDPQAVLQTIRRYVHVFFGCKECGEHFEEMAKESMDSVKTPDQAILWLWKKHNVVNSRLAGEQKPVRVARAWARSPSCGRRGRHLSFAATLPARRVPACLPAGLMAGSSALTRCQFPGDIGQGAARDNSHSQLPVPGFPDCSLTAGLPGCMEMETSFPLGSPLGP